MIKIAHESRKITFYSENIFCTIIAFNIEEKYININSLYIDNKYRNKKLSYLIINYVLKYFIQFIDTLKQWIITLDDCSDRYKKTHNLYINIGFSYIDEHGPEMSANLYDILSNLKHHILQCRISYELKNEIFSQFTLCNLQSMFS